LDQAAGPGPVGAVRPVAAVAPVGPPGPVLVERRKAVVVIDALIAEGAVGLLEVVAEVLGRGKG